MTPCLPSRPRLTFEPANPPLRRSEWLELIAVVGLTLLAIVLAFQSGTLLAGICALLALIVACVAMEGWAKRGLSWWLHRALPFGEMEAQVFSLTRRVMLQANAPVLTHIPVLVSWRLDAGGVHLNSLRLGGMPSLRNAKRHITALPTLPLRTPRWYPVLSWACRRLHIRPKAHALLRAVTAHERMALLAALASPAAIKPAPRKTATTQTAAAP